MQISTIFSQYLYTGFESSLPVFWSWHRLHSALQLSLSQNSLRSPRCGIPRIRAVTDDINLHLCPFHEIIHMYWQ